MLRPKTIDDVTPGHKHYSIISNRLFLVIEILGYKNDNGKLTIIYKVKNTTELWEAYSEELILFDDFLEGLGYFKRLYEKIDKERKDD